MSFLGPYDRELDSDEEELSFEEQFILRMPPGEDCSKLREMVASREISPDVWFKLKGTLSQYAFSKHILVTSSRLASRCLPHRGQYVFSETG
jgi:hypothetical protein